MLVLLQTFSNYGPIALGFLSAMAWFYASTLKITRERAVAALVKKASKKGEKPNLAGMSIGGWDLLGTLAAQSRWNAVGALLAGGAVGLEALGKLI